MITGIFEPGILVENPSRPDWGIGQVQSAVDNKVTVNFPDLGKVVVDVTRVLLLPCKDS